MTIMLLRHWWVTGQKITLVEKQSKFWALLSASGGFAGLPLVTD